MRDSGPALSDQRIKGAQHRGLAALVTEHCEAPAGFILINSSAVGGGGDQVLPLSSRADALALDRRSSCRLRG